MESLTQRAAGPPASDGLNEVMTRLRAGGVPPSKSRAEDWRLGRVAWWPLAAPRSPMPRRTAAVPSARVRVMPAGPAEPLAVTDRRL